MNKENLVKQIKASTKLIECDLVIKNITIIDVFNKNRFIDTIGIKNGYIIGIGDYESENVIDGTGKYICPGLIDAHCHIESSLVTPLEYHKVALLNGITSVIADPHEIANVMGTRGIEFMINSSNEIPFDMYFMLPSCVPGTNFESSNANLLAKDLNEFYQSNKVLGLAEVMNYPAVFNCEDSVINKIYDAIKNDKVIDGHGAGLSPMMVNSYRTANILTDHECTSAIEATDKVRKGMYILIREGTVAKNLKELLPAVNNENSNRFCFCTDDKHIDDMKNNGSINALIVHAIEYGLRPETAIQMATLNPSILYKINNKGAIAPGFIADFVILDNLEEFKINSVYKKGILVVKNGALINDLNTESNLNSSNNNFTENSVKLSNKLTENDFIINLEDKSILNVIEVIPNKLETIHHKVDIKSLTSIKDENTNYFKSSVKNDLIKIAVIERHKASYNIGLGILKGLGIKEGAIATTIAHDSHNLIVAGTNDKDMLFAAKELEKIHGGIIIVKNETVLASIQLEIAGLMTNRQYTEIENDLKKLHDTIKILAPNINFDPFLTLSFLSLPVIPDLKITDKGLFDVVKFKFIDICE